MTSHALDQPTGMAAGPTTPRLLRTAGWASIVLAAVFVLQLLLLLFYTGDTDPNESLHDFLAHGRVTGFISALLWLVAGVATVVITRAMGDEQARRRADSMVTTTTCFLSY